MPDGAPPAGRAAAYLAPLLGLPEDLFGGDGRPGTEIRQGADDLLRRLVLLRPLEEPPGTPEGRALRRRISDHYGRAWKDHFEAMNAAFFAFGERCFRCVLRDADARWLGSLTFGRHQANVGLVDGRVVVLFTVGRETFGLYDPGANTLVWLNTLRKPTAEMLRSLLFLVLPHPEPFARWLRRATAGRLDRAFVVGDNRPGHFIKESLAYLDLHLEDRILPFLHRGGRLVVVPDWCAMDPLPLFPELAAFPSARVPSAALTMRQVDLGLDGHRVYRFVTHRTPDWLRRRLAALAPPPEPEPPGRRFKVLLSVDAERMRFLNQTEAFRHVLRRLGAACAADGSALDVAWDGWTVPAEPDARDHAVIARIEAAIEGITRDLGVPLRRQVRLHGRSAAAKVAETATCDLVLVTQGTGAVVPCWLLRRPSVTYHVAAQVADRSCVDESVVVNVEQRAIAEVPPSPGTGEPERFSIALWALDAAVVRAVGDRLPLGPPLPAPA